MIYYYTIDGITIECRVSNTNINIKNSYLIKKDKSKIYLINILLNNFPLFREKRTVNNILNEWKAHNILYSWNFKKERTKDTDIELEQKLIYKIGYFLISHLFREK